MLKHTQTIVGKLPTNCLSVFDHFVSLALRGLISKNNTTKLKKKNYFRFSDVFKGIERDQWHEMGNMVTYLNMSGMRFYGSFSWIRSRQKKICMFAISRPSLLKSTENSRESASCFFRYNSFLYLSTKVKNLHLLCQLLGQRWLD